MYTSNVNNVSNFMCTKKGVLLSLGLVFLTTEANALCRIHTENGKAVATLEKDYPPVPQRSYNVKGQTYTPLASADGFTQDGDASWYGRPFHGRITANGETYNMFDYTAAHPTLPIPSCVRVTNTANGKSVVVRINDRGPFKSDLGTDTSKRVIDLSLKAAIALDFRDKGITSVKLEALPTEYPASTLSAAY